MNYDYEQEQREWLIKVTQEELDYYTEKLSDVKKLIICDYHISDSTKKGILNVRKRVYERKIEYLSEIEKILL